MKIYRATIHTDNGEIIREWNIKSQSIANAEDSILRSAKQTSGYTVISDGLGTAAYITHTPTGSYANGW